MQKVMRGSFSYDDPAIRTHLEAQDNASRYITRLIEQDMEGNSKALDEVTIRRIVREEMGKGANTTEIENVIANLF